MMPLRTHGVGGIRADRPPNAGCPKSAQEWAILRVVEEKAPSGRPLDAPYKCKGHCQPKSPLTAPTRSPSAPPCLPLSEPSCVRHSRDDRISGAGLGHRSGMLSALTPPTSPCPASSRRFDTRRPGSGGSVVPSSGALRPLSPQSATLEAAPCPSLGTLAPRSSSPLGVRQSPDGPALAEVQLVSLPASPDGEGLGVAR